MLTLSFGFKKPETNDSGSVVFPALESNIQKMNDHTHDGANSSKIPSSSITKVTTSILSAGWVLVANGIYKQTVTLPGAVSYDTTKIVFKLTATGHEVFPTVEKVSASQYDVFLNDNTVDLSVMYL